MKYREKSTVIMAIQFLDGNFDEMKKWIGVDNILGVNENSRRIAVSTSKGAEAVEETDWVVRNQKGLSIVKDEEFKEKYEPAV